MAQVVQPHLVQFSVLRQTVKVARDVLRVKPGAVLAREHEPAVVPGIAPLFTFQVLAQLMR